MKAVIGSARISENGTINGKPGDSTKNEVGTQNWYLHPKGWVCIRPKNKEMASKIAECMLKLCNNDHFGYGQSDRDNCLPLLEKAGYDPSKVTQACNIDCSLSILVCCRYAGISIAYDNKANLFYTGNIAQRLKATGMFDVLADAVYCTTDKNLKEGDILCTKTKGHVVAVVSVQNDTISRYINKGTSVDVTAIQHEGTRVPCRNTRLTVTSTVALREKPNYELRDSWLEIKDGYVSAYTAEGIVNYDKGSWILHDGYKWKTSSVDVYDGKTFIINKDGYIDTAPKFNSDGSIRF